MKKSLKKPRKEVKVNDITAYGFEGLIFRLENENGILEHHSNTFLDIRDCERVGKWLLGVSQYLKSKKEK